MKPNKFSKKQKLRGDTMVQPELHALDKTTFSDAKTSDPNNLGDGAVHTPEGCLASAAYFVTNFVGSVLFHIYLAFLPVVLRPLLLSSPLFARCNPDQLTLLIVLITNASWIEFFDSGCIADASSAFIRHKQEKQFRELHGSGVHTETKRRWFLGGLSGLLGALSVGLFAAFISPLQPFSSVLPLFQELPQSLPRNNPGLSHSFLTGVLGFFTPEERRVEFATWLQNLLLAAIEYCPAFLLPLLADLQHALQAVPLDKLLEACSLLLSVFVAEFLCCFIFFLVVALVSSASFYFKLKHAARINLAVLLIAVAAALPYCDLVGGPMLGISFTALVAASRLDPWCFALMASADFLAALFATRFVQPLPTALLSGRKQQDVLKKNQ